MAQLNIKQINGASQGSILFLGTNSVTENFDKLNWNSINNTLYVSGTVSGNTGTFSKVNTTWVDFVMDHADQVPGRLSWDSNHGTLNIGLTGGNVNLAIGQEFVIQVFNGEDTTLLDGEVVYIDGAQGDKIKVKRASNLSDVTSSKTLGVVTEPIGPSQIGFVTSQGIVSGLNLSFYNKGDIVWLGSTAGTYQKEKPVAPNHLVFIGVVLRNNDGDGLLYVNPQNGYELDEIHDVLISGTANGDLLSYESSTGLWKNKTTSSLNIATGSGVTNYVPRWLNSNNISSTSSIYDDGLNVGIGTMSSSSKVTIASTSSSLSVFSTSIGGNIFDVSNSSGSILEVLSDGTSLIGDYDTRSLYATKKITIGTSSTNIWSFDTASYDGAFIDYVIKNGSNSRSGNLMCNWNGSSIQYTENSTLDIGVTSGFTFSFTISGTYSVLSGQSSTDGWIVKTIIRSI